MKQPAITKKQDISLSKVVDAILDTVTYVNEIHQKVEHMRGLLMEQYKTFSSKDDRPFYQRGELQ